MRYPRPCATQRRKRPIVVATKQGIAATRKKLEADLELIGRTVAENVQGYIAKERERLVKEFDDRLLMQSQLQGFDLAQWDVAQNFTFEWPFDRGQAFMVKVGDKAITTVAADARANYQGFFLWKRMEAKKE